MANYTRFNLTLTPTSKLLIERLKRPIIDIQNDDRPTDESIDYLNTLKKDVDIIVENIIKQL